MTPIQTALRQLMKQEGWTAESVRKAIEKLQNVSVENKNLIPFILLGEKKQKILNTAKQQKGIVEVLGASTLRWFSISRSRNLIATDILRISPSFEIDLSDEVPPRYEDGTPLVVTEDGDVAVVVHRKEYHRKQSNPSDNWCAIKCNDGRISWVGGGPGDPWEFVHELPPRPTLQAGWEYTGKAAKIEDGMELAEGEAWVQRNGQLATGVRFADPDANDWRHLARKVEQEASPEVEYVDRPVLELEWCDTLCILDLNDAAVNLSDCMNLAGFIAYIYADGTGSQSPRKAATNWNPALIPTHVRMAKGAE